MPKKTVVLCSGGLDSVGLLWKLLNETDDDILVQHIRHKGFYGFWKYEEEAFENCMNFLKEHSRSFIVLPTMEFEVHGFTNTRTIPSFVGGISAHLHAADRIVIGTIGSDVLNSGIQGGFSYRKNIAAVAVFKVVANYNMTIIRERPLETYDKRDLFTLLPPELIDQTVTCKHPEYINGKWVTCRKCDSCFRYNEAKLGLDPVPPTHLAHYNPRFPIEPEIIALTKKPVIMFTPTLEHDNILYLYDLLVNTDKHIIIQPVEILRHNELTEERKKLQQIIDFLAYSTRKFLVLPSSKLITNIKIDERTKELAKKFCLAHAAYIYKDYIDEVSTTYPSKRQNKENCEFIFKATSMDELKHNVAILENTTLILPEKIKEILDY